MSYDVIVIGAGPAGEAAAYLGRELGASVAVVEKDLAGGECPFWACMPSKTLLAAATRRAVGADYPWERASRRRDWMISREDTDYPSDAGHVAGLEGAGVRFVRGEARLVGAGKVEVRSKGNGPQTLEGANVIVAAGSAPVIPPIRGLDEAGYWTSREGTSLRELPSSIVVLGGGPVGVELAQVYARFGVKTVLVEGHDRILPRDHPRSSEVVTDQLRTEGIDVRTRVHATAVRTGGEGRILEMSDGGAVEGAELLVAVGRRAPDLRAMGLEEAGVELSERGTAGPDEQLRVGPGVFLAGDAAGGLMFTHVADYEGRVTVAAAMGHPAKADLGSVPRATFTDPEVGAVGLTVEEAQEQGIDAFEVSQDFASSARGFTLEPVRPSSGPILEGVPGHVTAVIDRGRGLLAGAFAACPGASDLIHEAVLAMKHSVPVAVLADAIHAFPTASRVFGGVMVEATKQLG